MTVFFSLSLLIIVGVITLVVYPLFKKETTLDTNHEKGQDTTHHHQATPTEKIAKQARLSALAYIGLIPLALTFIYLKIGTPGAITLAKEHQSNIQTKNLSANSTPSQPEGPFQAIANLPPDQQKQMIEQMVSGLEQRLLQSPDDIPGWRRLARSQSVMGNYEKSAAAWREVIARSENVHTDDWRGLAVSLLDAGAGEAMVVDAELENALQKVLAVNQSDPLALFFLGMAARDKGDRETAQKLWSQLRSQLPDDAPVMNRIQDLLTTVSEKDAENP